jgi:D-alanine-D-alanine ligase
MSQSLKILVVFDTGKEPAADCDYREELASPDFETESHVIAALKRLGHQPIPLGVCQDLRPLIGRVEQEKPNLIFNLAEAFRLQRRHEPHLVGLLEMLGVPFTGADPTALMLCKDKALAKKSLSYHRVKTPRFVVSHRVRPLKRLKLNFPAFVKPLAEEGSEAIARAALAGDEASALERVRFVHESTGGDALVEEFVEGREFYVGVLGNGRLQVLPLVELFIGKVPIGDEDAPSGAPRFYTYKAKWDEAYRKKWGIRSGPPADLPEPQAREIAETAKRACIALRVRGYARVDLRLTSGGDIYVIEVNPNPGLAKSDEFAQAAARADLGYDALVARIVQLAERSSQ